MAHVGMMCRTCCNGNCTIATSNFDVADTSTVTGWTEADGDWEIVSNRLKPPQFGIILFDTEDPEDPADDGIRWKATANFGGAVGTLEWLVDYGSGPAEYFFARVECTGATTATLRLYNNTDSSNVPMTPALALSGFSWNSDFTVAVCLGLQYVQPACGSGTVTWVWTLDYFPNGDPGWQPRSLTGDCQSGSCAELEYPEVTGTEIEGDTTTTGCGSVTGTAEGGEVFGISATFNDSQAVASAATSHGHTHVGLRSDNIGSDARFDDAVLSRLKNNCPDCGSAVPACDSGCEYAVPSIWLVEFEGIANVATDPTVCNCDDANRSMLLPAAVEPCRWQEYFGPPAWEYCPGEELEGVDGSHIWAGEVFIPADKLIRLVVRQPPVDDGPGVGFGETIAVFQAFIPTETACDEVERLELFTATDLSEVLVNLGLLGDYEICDYTGWRVFISAVA